MHPFRNRVITFVRRHHRRLGPPDQQHAQVRVAALGDGAQVVLAPAGVLPWRTSGAVPLGLGIKLAFERRP